MTSVQTEPTLEEIRRWPATVDVRRACRAIGISASWGYQLAAEDAFPVRVIKVGSRIRVPTSGIIALLDAESA